MMPWDLDENEGNQDERKSRDMEKAWGSETNTQRLLSWVLAVTC
jgi:hypothetical protein